MCLLFLLTSLSTVMDFFDTLFSFIKPKEINEYEASNPTSKICTEEVKSFKEQEEEKLIVKADGNLADIEEKSGNPQSIRKKSKSGEFKCNECEYTFCSKQSLKFHFEAVHLRINKFFCRFCDYKCYHITSMRHHMKSKHEGNEEHDSFSGQKKDRGQLGRHWSKSGELKCNECEYSSDRKQSLKFHYEALHLVWE